MPKKNSSKKYINDELDELEEHYYQNQNMNQNASMLKARQYAEANMNIPPLHQSNTNGANLASSSTSSQKPLLTMTTIGAEKRIDFTYLFVVFAIICLVGGLITTAITFIFPFWISLTISTAGNTGNFVNITNTRNKVSLTATDITDIKFYVGLWEVKMDRWLTLRDASTPGVTYNNSYPYSMLWLNADINKPNDAFLVKFSQFIDLTTSNLFIVEILEILHLVFIFFAFCFTSFTVCLCSPRSFCWYLVCLLLSLLAFLLGAAVIGLLVYWDTFYVDQVRSTTKKYLRSIIRVFMPLFGLSIQMLNICKVIFLFNSDCLLLPKILE